MPEKTKKCCRPRSQSGGWKGRKTKEKRVCDKDEWKIEGAVDSDSKAEQR